MTTTRASRAISTPAWSIALVVACSGPPLAPRPAPPPPDELALLAARDRGDVAAMRAHGWELWSALQSRWPSWERSDVVLGQPDRVLRPLRPFRTGDTIEAETLPVMFSVVFDPTAAAHIRRHRLGARTALRRLDAVPEFPRSAIALKLVWYPVHRDRRTVLPIWDGLAVLDAGSHPDRSWPRAIVVEDSGVVGPPAGPERAFDVPGGGDSEHAAPRDLDGTSVVPLDAFLHRPITGDAELAAARRIAGDPSLARGDQLILLGMHVTTKEIPDWVWATFWWHDRADVGRFAAGRTAAVTGAARSYLMDVAYSADTPREADGSPHACMNPWLEARFPGGVGSNCLTCHQRAAFGAADFLPVTRRPLAPGDPYFAGKTTTDFLWTLALEAR